MRTRLGLLVAAATLLATGCGSASDVAESAASTTQPPTTSEATASTDTTTTPETRDPPSTSASTATTSSSASPKPAVAPRPRAGNCYVMSRAAFRRQRDDSSPVRCGATHNAETFLVFDAPASPSGRLIARTWRTCYADFHRYVGRSATVSRLGMTIVFPGQAQLAAGQGWVRCDALELASYNVKAGEPRRGSLRGVLSDGVPREFRGCVRHWPKPTQPVHFTSCKQRHQAELIPQSISLGGPDDKFPGENTTKRRSDMFCMNNFQNYVTETDRYYYYYPTAASWRAGTHDTTCWALDIKGDNLPPI